MINEKLYPEMSDWFDNLPRKPIPVDVSTTVDLPDLGEMVAVVEYEDGTQKTVAIDSFEEGGHMIEAAMAWDSSIVKGYTAQRAPVTVEPAEFSFMGDEPEEVGYPIEDSLDGDPAEGWTPAPRNDSQPTSLDL